MDTRVSEAADFIDSNMKYLIMFLILLAALILIILIYIVCRMTREKRPVIQKLRSSQKLDPQVVVDDSKTGMFAIKAQRKKKFNMDDDVSVAKRPSSQASSSAS